jgi:Ca2+-binding EF-hand superfamily protein
MGRTESSEPAPGFRNDDRLLDTDDLKHALDLAVNLGKPSTERGEDGTYRLFELPFYCKKVLWDDALASSHNAAFQRFLESDSFKDASNALIKALDMDGDGKLTPKDFQIMYDSKLTPALSRHRDTLDKWLPFVGQCTFGFVVGLGFGALARNMYKGKWWIAGTGLAAYSGLQYLAQQNFVNQKVLEESFKAKVKELADVNGDGEINREDLNALVENRMRFISTKLGPGGLAPGVAGYASLALGFARGIRFI